MAPPTSIAVLPFLDLSAQQDQAYFCEGTTEEIINALTRVEGLLVTSRTSSFYFKGQNLPLQEIGEALNVASILEGSIRFADNQIRLTAQLIDVATDQHLFSEVFDRPLQDIFALQDEISLLIADRLREHFGHLEIADQLFVAPPVPVAVYQEYLEARYRILNMNPADLEAGLAATLELIDRYPQFTQAYLAAHLAYTIQGTIGYLPAADAFRKGQHYLDQAVQQAPDLPECQLQLSHIAFLQHWDLRAAYQHLQRLKASRPLTEYFQSMASLLVAEGQFSAAMNYIEEGLQLDPFSNINFHLKGFIHYCQENYNPAIRCFRRSLELNPHFIGSRLYLGQALILDGKPQQALAYFEALEEDPNDLLRHGGITLAKAALGERRAAESGMEKIIKATTVEGLAERALNFLILVQTALGDTASAIGTMKKAVSARFPMVVYFFVEPLLQSLREEVEFEEARLKIIGTRTVYKAPKKYQQSLFTPKALEDHRQQLLQLMDTEHPFLNPKLTLRELAQRLGLSANQLSQLLNESIGKNFAAFVNTYRLAAFKAKAADPHLHHYSILGLALESGFNSKTVFNAYFKKRMGLTPSAYCKSIGRK
ncbi:MAG: helix-turn-helix domain-containing protein [Bacteroidota bacterium]